MEEYKVNHFHLVSMRERIRDLEKAVAKLQVENKSYLFAKPEKDVGQPMPHHCTCTSRFICDDCKLDFQCKYCKHYATTSGAGRVLHHCNNVQIPNIDLVFSDFGCVNWEVKE